MEKFGHRHSCTCGDKYLIIKDTTEVVGCDFKNKTIEGFKGYLWHKSDCGKCDGIILTGHSYSDYRVTGEGLLLSAIQASANNFSYKTFDLLTKQFYNGKHFQGKFIKKNEKQKQ
jgi:hypothetical protein